MLNTELEQIINQQLDITAYQDYAPNGLQVEGKAEIKTIVTGVTASQLLIDEAIKHHADAIIVHHGYFWKNEPVTITGMKYRRIKSLLQHNINLFAYHLPLDGHPTLGNNAQLAEKLLIKPYIPDDKTQLLWQGEFSPAITAEELRERLEQTLDHAVLHSSYNAPALIKKVAWCSGGGQHFIEQAVAKGAQAFISGEVSEQTIHLARECGLNFYAAGHHATERYGVKALGEWLAKMYQLKVLFIDIDNPA